MVSAGDFKNGLTLEIEEGQVFQILEFQHVKPGKGAAFVRTKIRNVITGSVVERTFRPTEKFPQARIDRDDMQYLYADGDMFNFMDNETYDQISLSVEQLDGGDKFLKENMDCQIMLYQGNVLGVELPNTVELAVIETEPGIKGDTASGGTKPATLETGVVVQVPFFINTGDVLKVDTRNGSYIERA